MAGEESKKIARKVGLLLVVAKESKFGRSEELKPRVDDDEG